jgi:dolichyl-phosphate beta-glucosyltransferase
LAFDSELLFALKQKGEGWIEVPLNWTEKEGGKVKPMRDAWGMLAALVRIRCRKSA